MIFLSSFDQPIEAAEPFEILAKPFTVAELHDSMRQAFRMRPALAEKPYAA
ncbi:MAG: hypothetical protein P4L99_25415 [Chthoniobacter sp.]|nr:hypothetical protein [Chthoniobacter sp.]